MQDQKIKCQINTTYYTFYSNHISNGTQLVYMHCFTHSDYNHTTYCKIDSELSFLDNSLKPHCRDICCTDLDNSNNIYICIIYSGSNNTNIHFSEHILLLYADLKNHYVNKNIYMLPIFYNGPFIQKLPIHSNHYTMNGHPSNINNIKIFVVRNKLLEINKLNKTFFNLL